MRVAQCVVVVLLVCVACVCAGPLQQQQSSNNALLDRTSHHRQVVGNSGGRYLSRSKRWILTWLLGHGFLQDHVDSKRDSKLKPAKKSPKHNTRHNDEDEVVQSDGLGNHNNDENNNSSAEVHNPPGTVLVDLSGDTRVNYQDGRSKIGALARESDAEVFDWNLLREDMERNSGDENPHYFQSSSSSNRRPAGLTSSYRAQPRPVRGFVRRTATSHGVTGSNLNTFNRFPIPYEQSQEFHNHQKRHFRTSNY